QQPQKTEILRLHLCWKPLGKEGMEARLECGKAAGKKIDNRAVSQMRDALDEPQQIVPVDRVVAFRARQQFFEAPPLQRVRACDRKGGRKAIELEQDRTCRARVHLLANQESQHKLDAARALEIPHHQAVPSPAAAFDEPAVLQLPDGLAQSRAADAET